MSVKVYIGKEVRRFPLAPYSTFSSLVSKIGTFYSDQSSCEKSLKIYWRDADNDLILISCEEELKEALSNAKGDVLRLFVSPSETAKLATHAKSPSDAGPNAELPLHPGIECDGCDGPVRGSRFKCLVCPNFDLCEICERVHKHDQHAMLRISSPGDKCWQNVLSKMLGTVGQLQYLTGDEYLTKMGDVVTNFMKNFGIDVDYEVRPPATETEKGEKQQDQATPEKKDGGSIPEMVVESSTPTQEKVKMVVESSTPVQEQINSPAVGEWIMLDKNATGESSEIEHQAAKPPEIPILSDLDIMVNRSLNCMLSMGFTNEDDLLKRLLYKKKADVAAVLDILQPK